jgi:hypothetical protein
MYSRPPPGGAPWKVIVVAVVIAQPAAAGKRSAGQLTKRVQPELKTLFMPENVKTPPPE